MEPSDAALQFGRPRSESGEQLPHSKQLRAWWEAVAALFGALLLLTPRTRHGIFYANTVARRWSLLHPFCESALVCCPRTLALPDSGVPGERFVAALPAELADTT